MTVTIAVESPLQDDERASFACRGAVLDYPDSGCSVSYGKDLAASTREVRA